MDVYLSLIYVSAFVGLFMSLTYLLTVFENRTNLGSPKPKKHYSVSIIIPAFNEEGRIKKTIQSLLNLDYPKHLYEVLVIDDGSIDTTWKEIQRFKSHCVRIFSKTNGGKASALNYGIKRAKGDIIVTLDADSFVDKNALKNMVGYFDNPKCMAVTPAMKIWKPKSLLQRIQFVEYLMGIFVKKAASYLNCIHVTPGPFSAYRKSFFEKHGYYDEGNLTEDMEVALRIQSKNFVIENAPNAYSYTIGPSRFKALYSQRTRWYLGFINNVWRYRQLFGRQYGTLGMFYLPAAFISVFLTIALVFYMFKLFFHNVYQSITNLWYINFDFMKILNFRFDWFYWTPNTIAAISFLTLAVGSIVFLLGRRISNDKEPFLASYVLSLFLYAPLYTLWWLSSIAYKVTGKDIKWGGVVWKKD